MSFTIVSEMLKQLSFMKLTKSPSQATASFGPNLLGHIRAVKDQSLIITDEEVRSLI